MKPARPITDTIRHIGFGSFIDEASDELNKVVSAVEETGKQGSVTLKISVKKATRSGAMHIAGNVTSKLPDMPHEAMMFPTPEGNLVTNDPNQENLDLKVAEGSRETLAKDLKTVNE